MWFSAPPGGRKSLDEFKLYKGARDLKSMAAYIHAESVHKDLELDPNLMKV
jgi:hypothetical protein